MNDTSDSSRTGRDIGVIATSVVLSSLACLLITKASGSTKSDVDALRTISLDAYELAEDAQNIAELASRVEPLGRSISAAELGAGRVPILRSRLLEVGGSAKPFDGGGDFAIKTASGQIALAASAITFDGRANISLKARNRDGQLVDWFASNADGTSIRVDRLIVGELQAERVTGSASVYPAAK